MTLSERGGNDPPAPPLFPDPAAVPGGWRSFGYLARDEGAGLRFAGAFRALWDRLYARHDPA